MRNFNIMSDEELNKRYAELTTDNTYTSERVAETQDDEINEIRAELEERGIFG